MKAWLQLYKNYLEIRLGAEDCKIPKENSI